MLSPDYRRTLYGVTKAAGTVTCVPAFRYQTTETNFPWDSHARRRKGCLWPHGAGQRTDFFVRRDLHKLPNHLVIVIGRIAP